MKNERNGASTREREDADISSVSGLGQSAGISQATPENQTKETIHQIGATPCDEMV